MKRFMKGLLSIFKSKYFWGGIGALLVISLLLVLGAWLEWSMTVRLLSVIGVLVVCILVLGIAALQANKKSSEIEKSISSQGKTQEMNTRPDQRPEVEQLRRRLEGAIETLKNSKLGQGKRGSAALYALPWYMFIGPPAAGKTSAIANSGLNFPLGIDKVQGVGGTRNCDWFFSDSAILLDTAGRYVTEDEDTDEWHGFLDILKRNRRRQPINGVIIGISVAKLAQVSDERIDWHANNMRRRIDELVKRLGVRFPVYLMFTKCDLLDGFVEFFDGLSREEREQVWGATLGEEEQEESDMGVIFDREFDELYRGLLDRRAQKLSRSGGEQRLRRSLEEEPSAEDRIRERQDLYVFPLEFASVKENLRRFVELLFQPNPYQESPICRGFYFSSGTQEGQLIDRVIAPVTQEAGVTPERTPEHDTDRPPRSYFIKDLFTRIIIPDQYLVQQTSRAVSRKQWRRAAVATVSTVLLVLFLLGASQAFVRSQRNIDSVGEAATAVKPVQWNQGPGSGGGAAVLGDKLDRMDRLRTTIGQLETYEKNPPLFSWGLYRGGELLRPARRLYLRKARGFVKNQMFNPLGSNLRRATLAGRSSMAAGRDSLYDDLRAYMMMTTRTDRLESAADRTFLKNYLEASTRSVGGAVEQQGPDPNREKMNPQVVAFVEGLYRGRIQGFKGNESLVGLVRNLVYEPPSIAGLYERIKEEGDLRLPPMTLNRALQGRSMPMFAVKPEVSGFFTKEGWEGYVKEAINEQAKAPDRISWVMGYEKEDLPTVMKDKDKLVAELKTMYFKEYASAWMRFLRAVEYKPLTDVRTAARRLGRLGNAFESPLLYLLAQVHHQTTFEKGMLGKAQEQVKKSAGQGAKRAANRQMRRGMGRMAPRLDASRGQQDDEEENLHPVARRFQWLHALKANEVQSGGAAPALSNALSGLASIGNTLSDMTGDGAQAADFVAQTLQNDGGELKSAQQSIRGALSRFDQPTRKHLFSQAIESAWKAALGAAQQHLNERWRDEVYRPYQEKLAGRYPLVPGSDREVALHNFEGFFHPEDGIVASFRSQVLSRYLTRDGRRMKTWNGEGLRFSPSAHQAFEKAAEIGQRLFGSGSLQLRFEMQPEQPATGPKSPPIGQVYIELHGRGSTYRMGSYRPWKQYVWPGRSGALLRVTAQRRDLPPLKFEGDWAFFRLLQKANVRKRSSSEFQLRWPMGKDVITRFNLRAQSAGSPFGNVSGFFRFRCPPALN